MYGTPFNPFKNASANTTPAYLMQMQPTIFQLDFIKDMICILTASVVLKKKYLRLYAIESVAEPFSALASTTSVTPSCFLLVKALYPLLQLYS